ncbi:hypothetical protein [Ensifer sp.]|uniref:hypothetical protein n=1 Tax=Ensifer sp. TaxID=1872086 RepID=UPI00289BE153|nr:hypothetical protein [Ensifer sp.]
MPARRGDSPVAAHALPAENPFANLAKKQSQELEKLRAERNRLAIDIANEKRGIAVALDYLRSGRADMARRYLERRLK